MKECKKNLVARVLILELEKHLLLGGIGLALRGLRPIAEIQYLDYLLYAIQIMSDDISTLAYRTKGTKMSINHPNKRAQTRRCLACWVRHMGGIINLVRGMIVCVPRNIQKQQVFTIHYFNR